MIAYVKLARIDDFAYTQCPEMTIATMMMMLCDDDNSFSLMDRKDENYVRAKEKKHSKSVRNNKIA